MVMFEAENPDPAAGPILEQICVHGNLKLFHWDVAPCVPSQCVSRTKVVHKVSQKLCDPQGVT